MAPNEIGASFSMLFFVILRDDGKLIYTKTKVKAPLNKTTLAASLIKYFKDDDEQAKELAQFLLESREEKVKESIRRKVQK